MEIVTLPAHELRQMLREERADARADERAALAPYLEKLEALVGLEDLTVSQAADLYGVDSQTVYNWLKRGCPYADRSGVKRINRRRLSDWLTAPGSASPPGPPHQTH